MKVNNFLAAMVINVAIVIVIGFAVYYLHSGYPLFGLLLLVGAEHKKDDNDDKGEE